MTILRNWHSVNGIQEFDKKNLYEFIKYVIFSDVNYTNKQKQIVKLNYINE